MSHNHHGRDFLGDLKLIVMAHHKESGLHFWLFPAPLGSPQRPYFALNLHSFEQGYPLLLAKGR
ncbi:unannotated protein [freshwater metagenome]|uniref:Unannotated protein n=1 Tax=freshwater metagenome TaxID=449393 RepID=A0A6J6BLT0_9ZZZZ